MECQTMKPMNPTSSRTLCWLGAVILMAGFMIPSPSGAFFAFGLAGLVTAVPTIFGTGRTRFMAAILLLSSAGLAAGQYPDFRSDQERYRQKTKATIPGQQPSP